MSLLPKASRDHPQGKNTLKDPKTDASLLRHGIRCLLDSREGLSLTVSKVQLSTAKKGHLLPPGRRAETYLIRHDTTTNTARAEKIYEHVNSRIENNVTYEVV